MNDSSKIGNQLGRHLSSLKVISRLLGHELHTQSSGKSITLSRDEVVEIQTTIDLFIEEASKRSGSSSGGSGYSTGSGETTLVPARN